MHDCMLTFKNLLGVSPITKAEGDAVVMGRDYLLE
jgi:hypothetical protein